MKKNLIKKIALAMTVLVVGSTNVYAVNFNGYALPRCQGSKITRVHYKKDTDLTNTEKVSVKVVTNGGDTISDSITIEKGKK